MKRTWIVSVALVTWFVLLLILATAEPRGHGHGHKPTPTPSPMPTPTATPTPSPTPLPTPPHVTLAWDASTGAAGYHLWLGFASGQEKPVADEGTSLQATVQLTSGTTYYFVVTAYNAAGTDSLPSNEVSYTPP